MSPRLTSAQLRALKAREGGGAQRSGAPGSRPSPSRPRKPKPTVGVPGRTTQLAGGITSSLPGPDAHGTGCEECWNLLHELVEAHRRLREHQEGTNV